MRTARTEKKTPGFLPASVFTDMGCGHFLGPTSKLMSLTQPASPRLFLYSTELIHLYDYDLKGCYSCLACKRKDKATDLCSYPDGLLPILEKIRKADGVILGSPIYNGTDTAVMRAFIERLCYPFLFHTCPFKKPFVF